MSSLHVVKGGSTKRHPTKPSPPPQGQNTPPPPPSSQGVAPNLIKEGALKILKAASILMGNISTIPLGVATFSMGANLLKHISSKNLGPFSHRQP